MNEIRASRSLRLPLPPEDTWSEEARTAVNRVVTGPRGALLGPFVPLMRSPALLDALQSVGEHLRYRSSLRGTLLEALVLTVASRWGAGYEWSHHAPIAAAAGISADDISAIEEGREPVEDEDVAAVWAFVIELMEDGDVSEHSYRAAVERWGETATVELVSAAGYYTLLAWVLNVAKVLPDET